MFLDCHKVSKVYRKGQIEIKAIEDISIHIKKGEFIAIKGSSGSGKSTFMNIIGCLDRPTLGSYSIEGRNISGLSGNELALVRNKKIGFVFQNFQLIPQLSAIRNVEIPLIYAGYSKKVRKEMVVSVLASLGLGQRLNHKPTELSGGQQQRVAIARAIVTNPLILLADEPTGNLDSTVGQEVMDIFKDLNEKGKTVILISHDETIARQTNRIIELKDGKIVKDDLP